MYHVTIKRYLLLLWQTGTILFELEEICNIVGNSAVSIDDVKPLDFSPELSHLEFASIACKLFE